MSENSILHSIYFLKYLSHSSHNPQANVHSVQGRALYGFISNPAFFEYFINDEKYSNFSATIL
jgi:hypothetical protein